MIVFNSVLRTQSRRLGIALDARLDNTPPSAQLKAAIWDSPLACFVRVVLEPKGLNF